MWKISIAQWQVECFCDFEATPKPADEYASKCLVEDDEEAYDDFDMGGATPLISDIVSLSTDAGTFPVADYVGPDLVAYAYAEQPACQ